MIFFFIPVPARQRRALFLTQRTEAHQKCKYLLETWKDASDQTSSRAKEGMENGYVFMFTSNSRIVRQLLSVFTHQFSNQGESLSCESSWYRAASWWGGDWSYRLDRLRVMWVLPRMIHTSTWSALYFLLFFFVLLLFCGVRQPAWVSVA